MTLQDRPVTWGDMLALVSIYANQSAGVGNWELVSFARELQHHMIERAASAESPSPSPAKGEVHKCSWPACSTTGDLNGECRYEEPPHTGCPDMAEEGATPAPAEGEGLVHELEIQACHAYEDELPRYAEVMEKAAAEIARLRAEAKPVTDEEVRDAIRNNYIMGRPDTAALIERLGRQAETAERELAGARWVADDYIQRTERQAVTIADFREELTTAQSRLTAAEQERDEAKTIAEDFISRWKHAVKISERAIARAESAEQENKRLREALEPLVAACESEFTGPITADAADDESVAMGRDADGTPSESPITFGMIRSARAALTPESTNEQG